VSLPPAAGLHAAQLRVLLVDDHRVFTDSLRLTLDMQDDIRCVAVAHSVAEATAVGRRTEFDVAIVDLQLPDGGGLQAIGRLRDARPGARVLVLTAHPRADLAARALDLGAAAFLSKDGALTEILTAIRHADPARPLVCAAARHDPAARFRLTLREWDVLREMGVGRDASQTASVLGISVHTTRDHIKAIMGKMGVQTQLDAVVTAGRFGLIDIGLRA